MSLRRRYPVGAFSDELIESWIIQRRQGSSWGAIAKKEGYKPNFYSAIPYAIYAYLRRQDRLAEVQVLWHGYSTRWLARKFPEDAALLLSNTRDGRSLKNRGYRSKESVEGQDPLRSAVREAGISSTNRLCPFCNRNGAVKPL